MHLSLLCLASSLNQLGCHIGCRPRAAVKPRAIDAIGLLSKARDDRAHTYYAVIIDLHAQLQYGGQ